MAKEAASLVTLNQARPSEYKKEEILQIAQQHGHHFSSVAAWNKYAKENSLPSSTIILRWLDDKEQRKYLPRARHGLTKGELRALLLQHFKDAPPTAADWEKYRKTSRIPLPSQTVFIARFGSWRNALTETYETKNTRGEWKTYTKAELIACMKKYYPYHPPTTTEWSNLKKNTTDEVLPSTMPYIDQFGSWKNAIDAIYDTS